MKLNTTEETLKYYKRNMTLDEREEYKKYIFELQDHLARIESLAFEIQETQPNRSEAVQNLLDEILRPQRKQS